MKIPGLGYALKLLDRPTQRQFAEYLEDNTKNPPTGELMSHGGKLSERYAGWSYIGAYNPEDITYETFDKMAKHPQVAAGLAAVKLPILSTEWTVTSQDKDIAAFVYQTLKPLWRGLLRSTLTAINYGFAAHEKVWKIDNLTLTRNDEDGSEKVFYDRPAAFYKKIKSLHPEHISIKIDELDNFLGITQTFRDKPIEIGSEKSFIYTHAKGENFGNLYGYSRLRNIYDVWYWWMALSQFMLRYFERKGSPPVITRHPPGRTKDGESTAELALKMGKAVINDMVVALPSATYEGKTYKWDINYLMDDKRGEMFVEALNALETKMLRGLFVPERLLTQDIRTGSYALSQTHMSMFIMGEDGLIADLEDQLTKYIANPLVDYNFGTNAPRAFIEMERLSEKKREFLANIMKTMIEKGFAQPAVKRIADILGIPFERESMEPPPKPDDEKEKSSQMSLEERRKKWWRDPKPYENAKILEEIDGAMDERRDEFSGVLEREILNSQQDMVLKEVAKALKGKQPLKDIWFQKRQVLAANGSTEEIKVPWEPLKPKVQTMLFAYHREMYEFGQKTAIEEIGVKESPKADMSDLDKMKARALAVSDRWMSNVKYGVEMALLNVHNKTQADLEWEVKQAFEKFKNKNLPDIAETEGMFAINLGRKRVVERHS